MYKETEVQLHFSTSIIRIVEKITTYETKNIWRLFQYKTYIFLYYSFLFFNLEWNFAVDIGCYLAFSRPVNRN